MKMRKTQSSTVDEPKEPEEEIIVKFDFVATGSWDKNVIIWNA